MARRDDREYREYLTEEQRSQPGCPAREVVLDQRGRATSRSPGGSSRDAGLKGSFLMDRRTFLRQTSCALLTIGGGAAAHAQRARPHVYSDPVMLRHQPPADH